MQNDFVTGTLGNQEAQAIVPNVQAKVKEYADRGDRIIFTRDTHEENYLDTPEGKKLPVKHCINGTEGWQIVPGLEVENCEYIDKPTFMAVSHAFPPVTMPGTPAALRMSPTVSPMLLARFWSA